MPGLPFQSYVIKLLVSDYIRPLKAVCEREEREIETEIIFSRQKNVAT